MRALVIGVLVLGLACASAHAQPPAPSSPAAKPVPVLSELDRLALENLGLRFNNAQLQILNLQLQAAGMRAEYQRKLDALALAGYVLDPTALTYVPAAPGARIVEPPTTPPPGFETPVPPSTPVPQPPAPAVPPPSGTVPPGPEPPPTIEPHAPTPVPR